jgi:hypothetical protein
MIFVEQEKVSNGATCVALQDISKFIVWIFHMYKTGLMKLLQY